MTNEQELSFDELYTTHFKPIYNYVYYRVHNNAVADDLTAQIFERALRHFGQYQPAKAPFVVWLFTIARRVVQSYMRRQRLIQWLPLDSFRESHTQHNPETVVLAQIEQQALLAVLRALSQREQEIITFKFVAGLNNRQIAQISSLSESNVGTIVARSLLKLRRSLSQLQGVTNVETTNPTWSH
ncbi:sigma-70 family RNA polymerase sigma factor [Herpetosiphon llansteffanensis]